MKIIVNDTNILLDLADIDLLNELTQLGFELHTNDFIIAEVKNPNQITKINELVNTGKLFVATTDSSEYAEIMAFQSKNLSFVDCSIWYYSKKINGTLLTGDGSLRKAAKASGTEVKGILFVFDQLLEEGIITKKTACEKLKELVNINSRLPRKEVEKRLSQWCENYRQLSIVSC